MLLAKIKLGYSDRLDYDIQNTEAGDKFLLDFMKPIIISLITLLISVALSVFIKYNIAEFVVDIIALTSIIFTSSMTFCNWRGLQAVRHKMLEMKNEKRKSSLIGALQLRLKEIKTANKLTSVYHSETCKLVSELFKLDQALADAHKGDFEAIKDILDVRTVSERLEIILRGAE